MMKKILIFILFFVSVSGLAQNRELWDKANETYASAQYTKALEHYLSIASSGFTSKELYYNTANCYFKLKDYGHAVLYYERALKFNPSDKDILRNIEIARDYTLDKIEVLPEFILRSWVKNLNYSFSANTWSFVGIFFVAISLLLLLSFKYTVVNAVRKLSFIGVIAAITFAFASFMFSWSQVSDFKNKDFAIVMKAVASVKSSPDENGKDVFILHEGTKVKIVDKISHWNRVVLSDGRDGWIQEDNIEVI